MGGSNRVLITGAHGQLGWELARLIRMDTSNIFCLAIDYDDLDISGQNEVLAYCRVHKLCAIVNCAAYTAVDKAEKDAGAAFAANEKGAENMAMAAADLNIPLIHISTDFVFDGSKPGMYLEDDQPNPLNVYGQSKLAGEKAVLKTHAKSLIIRTSWLYSSRGTNFVKTILGVAEKQGHLKVVADQIGTPTYAADLAGAILQILPEIEKGYGHIFHYANEGVASWYDFAVAAIALSGVPSIIEPVGTSLYPTSAMRPANSVMSKEKVKKTFGLSISHWSVSLEQCIRELGYHIEPGHL